MEAPRQSAWSVRQREYRELVRARGDCGKHSYVTAVLDHRKEDIKRKPRRQAKQTQDTRLRTKGQNIHKPKAQNISSSPVTASKWPRPEVGAALALLRLAVPAEELCPPVWVTAAQAPQLF